MTILETLQTDHRQVKVLLETILSTNDAIKRGDLFKQFRTELTAHSRAEEMVLYRRMEKSEEGKDDALEGAVEHEIVDRLMEDLSRSRSVGSDKWTARCTVLQELLEHHIDEEVDEFFQDCSEDFRSRYSSQDRNSVHGRENQACECYHLKMRRRDGRAVLEI
jgi:Hemerythrin HHE cation binding domain